MLLRLSSSLTHEPPSLRCRWRNFSSYSWSILRRKPSGGGSLRPASASRMFHPAQALPPTIAFATGYIKKRTRLTANCLLGLGLTSATYLRPMQAANSDDHYSVSAEEQKPAPSVLLRIIWKLIAFLNDVIVERVFIVCRGVYVLAILAPVVLASPAVIFGRLDSQRSFEPTGRLWWYRLLRSQIERAGPTFIKLGQWAATRGDLFPEQFCLEMSNLHSNSKPHAFRKTREAVERALKHSLGRSVRIEEVFTEFDAAPIGVGAIAQVYRGRLRADIQGLAPVYDDLSSLTGWVAIKVMHPNSRAHVCRDLRILGFLARMLDKIPTLSWLSLPEEVETFAQMMLTQLDLRVEAGNLGRFKDGFKYRCEVRFPRLIRGICSRDVLVEEFVEAVPMNTFVRCRHGGTGTIYDKAISGIGLNAFLNMLVLDNFVHCDLHPGNIMVSFSPPRTWKDRLETLLNMLRGDPTIVRPPPDIEAARRLNHASLVDCEHFRNELDSLHRAGYTPQLVFLDTGLVAELEATDRANFLDLFRAVAKLDGFLAGQLMVARSMDPTTVIKPEAFCQQMEALLMRVKSKTLALSKVRIADILGDVTCMVRDHHVKLAGEFANVFVSVLILEGLGRQLDPDLDLLRVAVPLLREVGRQGGGRGLLKDEVTPPMPRNVGWLVRLWVWLEAIDWVQEAWSDRAEMHPSLLYLPDL